MRHKDIYEPRNSNESEDNNKESFLYKILKHPGIKPFILKTFSTVWLIYFKGVMSEKNVLKIGQLLNFVAHY